MSTNVQHTINLSDFNQLTQVIRMDTAQIDYFQRSLGKA